MIESRVQNWFGNSFNDLHPLLQHLHLHGGQLSGLVNIEIPDGVAGFFGKLLAKKLGIPVDKGAHQLSVLIAHHPDGMHWDRCFDNTHVMRSLFRPIGTRLDGYWLENTGRMQMRLTVDIQDGGWYWRCFEMRLFGWRLPMWLLPKSKAFKKIEEGRYKFYVGFSLPCLGNVLAYSGSLIQAST